ncbi:DoxX family membrane protein [candidate division KSB1 bacterium]|nr:DoxX family membrane protein [candidate division KSB1 bacterium]
MNLNAIIRNRYLFILFRGLVGFIFVYAGLEKIAAPAEFARVIYHYRILPWELVHLMAIILPWIELLTGLCLWLGLWIEGTSALMLGMLMLFSIAIGINLIRGVDLACGCHTPLGLSDKTNFLKLIEEVLLMLMLLQVFFHPNRHWCLEKYVGRTF